MKRRRGPAGACVPAGPRQEGRVVRCRFSRPREGRGRCAGAVPDHSLPRSKPSLDRRAALVAAGHGRRDGRRHVPLPAPRVKPRQARRQRHASAVQVAARMELPARVGVEDAVRRAARGAARRSAVGATNVAVPGRLQRVAAAAVTGPRGDAGLRCHCRILRDSDRLLRGRHSGGDERRRADDRDGGKAGTDDSHRTGLLRGRRSDAANHRESFGGAGRPG